MQTLELTLSCSAPVPLPPEANRDAYVTGWEIFDQGGNKVAASRVQSPDRSDDVPLWLAVNDAVGWLRALRLPVDRLTVAHFDPKVGRRLYAGTGWAGIVRRQLDALGYPWEVQA